MYLLRSLELLSLLGICFCSLVRFSLIDCANINPLQESDVLQTFHLRNHFQCQRLCWYRKPCKRYSFYSKKNDKFVGSGDNCLLHLNNGNGGGLIEGWMEDTASTTGMDKTGGCFKRPCLDTELCIPVISGTGPNFICTGDQDINECASSPCENGGSCVDQVNTYTCNCPAGYTGQHCEIDVDECASSPCENGGSCVDRVNTYTCNCPSGYTGQHCETDINECASSPCENGGSCVDQINTYTCNCPAGYTGNQCQIDINECASFPCENGGSCVDQVNTYTCNCPAGYTGQHCETETNECASSPCENGGSCVDQVNTYTCNCPAGYTGQNCETDVDECSSQPCANVGSCTDGVNGYTCTCSVGYTGHHCKTDIDECASSPCENGGSCVDQVNTYTCNCPAGYTGQHCETDNDECASSPCENGGSCVDQVNTYTCNCPARFIGQRCETAWQGAACTQDSDCGQASDLNRVCWTFSGTCLCTPGYYYSDSTTECLTECAAGDLTENFSIYKHSTINGHNDKYVDGLSGVKQCGVKCVQETGFTCRTSDFKASDSCILSQKTALTVPGDWDTAASDGWEYLQRHCE